MKIELTIEGSKLDGEVKDLLATLTPEQKQAMAKELLDRTIQSSELELLPDTVKQRALIATNQQFNSNLKIEKGKLVSSGYYNSDVPYDQKRFYEAKLGEFGTTAGYFKDIVLKEITELGKTQVTKVVNESETIRGAVEKAIKAIEEDLPKMVHDAAVIYFASQMEAMMSGLTKSLMQSGSALQITQSLQQKLSEKGIY